LLYDAFLDHAFFHAGYSLVIAGKGGWCFERRKDEKNVIRIDRYIADAEIKSLFRNAACVVYPYISATQSGVFTLAYRLGTPLLASDTPYFRDNIKNGVTGLLFKNQDKEDLASKMQELLFDTDTGQMKKDQAIFYDEHYSASRVMKEIEQLYT
jgi:glycosyltransferase involved in cell wall biosynthesis